MLRKPQSAICDAIAVAFAAILGIRPLAFLVRLKATGPINRIVSPHHKSFDNEKRRSNGNSCGDHQTKRGYQDLALAHFSSHRRSKLNNMHAGFIAALRGLQTSLALREPAPSSSTVKPGGAYYCGI
jgi:hypothetical protein